MRALILLLAVAWPCLAAEIKVAPEIRAKAGRLGQATATSDDTARIRWINGHADLDVIGADNGRLGIISSPKPGKYLIHLHSDAGGEPVPVVVIVEGEVTPVDPPAPTPLPTGPLRVLILFDSATLATVPHGKMDAMYSGKVVAALDAACAPDGKMRAHRTWSKTTDASGASKEWQAAFARAKRPATSKETAVPLPKVVAFRSEEFAGEWAVPEGEAAMLALIERIKGGK